LGIAHRLAQPCREFYQPRSDFQQLDGVICFETIWSLVLPRPSE
jgi:hypothetical protein